jgi:hypothetical protein
MDRSRNVKTECQKANLSILRPKQVHHSIRVGLIYESSSKRFESSLGNHYFLCRLRNTKNSEFPSEIFIKRETPKFSDFISIIQPHESEMVPENSQSHPRVNSLVVANKFAVYDLGMRGQASRAWTTFAERTMSESNRGDTVEYA